QYVLIDPTDEEESVLSTQLTIILDENLDLCGVFKPGGVSPMQRVMFQQCMDVAKKRSRVIRGAIEEAVGSLVVG
ncbi:Exosome complex component RRP43, partial [Quaeritorhiza haematococci]